MDHNPFQDMYRQVMGMIQGPPAPGENPAFDREMQEREAAQAMGEPSYVGGNPLGFNSFQDVKDAFLQLPSPQDFIFQMLSRGMGGRARSLAKELTPPVKRGMKTEIPAELEQQIANRYGKFRQGPMPKEKPKQLLSREASGRADIPSSETAASSESPGGRSATGESLGSKAIPKAVDLTKEAVEDLMGFIQRLGLGKYTSPPGG